MSNTHKDEAREGLQSAAAPSGLRSLLQLRESQLLAITEADREEMDEENPIIHAETGPNRFAILSMFFTDNDGVRIQEDLDLNELTVTYFTDDGEVEVEDGPLYHWAVEFYKNDIF